MQRFIAKSILDQKLQRGGVNLPPLVLRHPQKPSRNRAKEFMVSRCKRKLPYLKLREL